MSDEPEQLDLLSLLDRKDPLDEHLEFLRSIDRLDEVEPVRTPEFKREWRVV